MNKKPKGDSLWIIATSICLLLLYAAFVGLLWGVGVFDFPDTDAGAEVLAAVVGLLGGLFAALVTFVGVLLKHSVDQRNLRLKEEAEKRLTLEGDRNLQLKEEAEKRLALEGDRNLQLREEAEKRLTLEGDRNLQLKQDAEERLRLETFIRAAGLLATADGKPTPKTQQAGALFALADLGQLGFALALLREMWPAGAISPTSACWLVNECLLSEVASVQIEAASILSENAESLTVSTECFDFPQGAMGSWPTSLPLYAAQEVVEALFRAIRSRPARKWSTLCLNGVALTLVEAIRRDEDAGVRHMARLLLNILLTEAPVRPNDILILPDEDLDLRQISSETDIEEAERHAPAQGREMANKLKAWAKSTGPEPEPPPDAETTS